MNEVQHHQTLAIQRLSPIVPGNFLTLSSQQTSKYVQYGVCERYAEKTSSKLPKQRFVRTKTVFVRTIADFEVERRASRTEAFGDVTCFIIINSLVASHLRVE
jgi:hypothetical protein